LVAGIRKKRNRQLHPAGGHARRISADYIRTARAKGLSTSAVLFKHGLRNALIPIITILGLQFGTLLAA